MALFALSDLHLSLSADKPMDVFGGVWQDYMDKIRDNWLKLVLSEDLVIIGGDVSWATYLGEAEADFKYLSSLPGKKLIIKGNHDYWWESMTKLNNFLESQNISDISFLNNSAYLYENYSIAGTRLWQLPGSDGFGGEDMKIYERELIRLKLSLEEMLRLESENPDILYKRIAVFHYPPFGSADSPDEGVIKLLLEYGISECIYGHLHGNALKSAPTGNFGGIEFLCTSADYLDFKPLRIK